MLLLVLTIVLAALTAVGFRAGRGRALAMAGGLPKNLSSLPRYYGWYVALWGFLPAAAVAGLWLVLQPAVIETLVIAGLPDELRSLPSSETGLIYNDIRNAVAVGGVPGDPRLAEQEVQQRDRQHRVGHVQGQTRPMERPKIVLAVAHHRVEHQGDHRQRLVVAADR